MQRTVGAMLTVLVALLGIAGCGGSSGPTKAEFTRKAEAVCTRSVKQSANAGTGDSLGFVKRSAEEQRIKVRGMGTLTPPDELRDVYIEYKQVMAKRLKLMDRFIATVEAKQDPHELVDPASTARVQEEELARVLELKACQATL